MVVENVERITGVAGLEMSMSTARDPFIFPRQYASAIHRKARDAAQGRVDASFLGRSSRVRYVINHNMASVELSCCSEGAIAVNNAIVIEWRLYKLHAWRGWICKIDDRKTEIILARQRLRSWRALAFKVFFTRATAHRQGSACLDRQRSCLPAPVAPTKVKPCSPPA